ncbi:MAG: M28 family peptidase [Longimicrobiales bacterium]
MKTRTSTPALRLSALILLPTLAACAGGATEEPSPEAAAHRAVESITADDMAREIGVLAHDSMAGRDTPSPELEAAAEYLADRFRFMGLEPAGENGTFIHRYDYEVTRLSDEETTLRLADVEGSALEYGLDFFLVPGMQSVSAEAVYVGVTGEDSPSSEQRGSLILMDHPGPELDQSWQQRLMTALQPAMMAGAAGLVVILDPEFPAGMVSQLAPMMAAQQAPFPVVGITSAAAERLVEAAGHDLGQLRDAEAATSLGDAPVEVQWSRSSVTHRPPNVVAMLPGSDPTLRDSYVVLSAHFDHVGIGAPDETGDSIYNGADDDASGTAAIVAMAGAFASLPEAPARSVIFLAVSGEEKGLLGSMAYAGAPPIIDIESVVANVNMDMIGRNAPDTVIGIGQEYTTIQATLDEIQEHHPELGLNVILDPAPEKNFFFRSDQLAFVREGIPAIFFTTDDHEDYHRPSDEAEKIDNDKAARIARLGFLVAYQIAQDPTAPEWTEDGRRQVQEMLDRSPF